MRGAGGSDLDTTRLMPAVTVVQPADQACTDWPVAAAEDDEARLQRLLAFVARQEPRLNWAVGVHADGTTVLVTDVAHGWIPPGIALPEGVRLLAPARRAGRAPELVGITTCCKTYTPGDSLRRAVDSTAPTSSVQPRALPAIAGLSVELGIATQRHDGWQDEVFIVHGENRFPYDIEFIIRGESEQHRTKVACFGVNERVVVVLESPLDSIIDKAEADRLRCQVVAATGLQLDELITVRRGAIPTTTSGKLKRRAVAQAYRDGTLPRLATHAWTADPDSAPKTTRSSLEGAH